MTKYTTLAAITLPSGMVVGLAESQAAARKHLLAPAAGKGQYVTRDMVQFKAGETLHIEGDLPKNLQSSLEAEAKPKRASRSSASAPAAGTQESIPGADGQDTGAGSDGA